MILGTSEVTAERKAIELPYAVKTGEFLVERIRRADDIGRK